ncbi:MAG: pilus assembly protein [Rhodoferax sp.]
MPIRRTGVSLPIVMIFLVVIGLLTTVGVRRFNTNEKLARNQLDWQIAREAAEAALRDGERDIFLISGALQTGALCDRGVEREGGLFLTPPYFGPTCPRGQCAFDGQYYQTSDFDNSTAASPKNPAPWWTESRGGLWDKSSLANKPSDASGANKYCDFEGGVPLGTFTGTPRLTGVVRQPEYLIEYIKTQPEKRLFLVTARGFGRVETTEVVLQSYINFDR